MILMLGGCDARLGAFRAGVVLIVGIFLKPFIERMTYLRAAHADEIDSLNRLIDSFAIENATFELLDANTQEFLVLTLNLTAACFILGQVGIFVADFCRFREPGVQLALGRFRLVGFRHGLRSLRHLGRPIKPQFFSHTRKKPRLP